MPSVTEDEEGTVNADTVAKSVIELNDQSELQKTYSLPFT